MWETKLFYHKHRTKDKKKKSDKKHEKTYWQNKKMKGWQRRSKFETLIKRTENNKFKKTFAC